MAVTRTATRAASSLRATQCLSGALRYQRYPRLSCKASSTADTLPLPTLRRSFASSALLQAKKYTEDHEWIELSADGQTGMDCFRGQFEVMLKIYSGTIGVSKYAAEALGDVVYVELPTLGLEIGAGDTIGSVESVKSASDIMTPVSGVVTEINSLLEQKPGTINKSPEGDGWLAKMQIENTEEMDNLMSAEEYRQFTDEVKANEEAEH